MVILVLAEQQVRQVIEKIIQGNIEGIYEDDPIRPATIPTAYDIQDAVDKVMKNIGSPTFNAIHQVTDISALTSASKFNHNLYSLIDDFTVINNTLISQIYALTKQFNATEIEMFKVGMRLRELYAKVQRVLLTNRNAYGFLHSAGKNAILSSDIYSSAGIDISNGSVKLGGNFSKKLDLTFVRSMNVSTVIGSDSSPGVKVTPVNNNTIPADAFDDIADSYWMVVFRTEGYAGEASIRFEFPLSSIGDPVAIDQLTVETIPGPSKMKVSMAYTNKYTGDTPVQLQTGGATITLGGENSNIADFMIPALSIAGGTSNPTISTIQLTLTKDVADSVTGNTSEYRFIVKKIAAITSRREVYGNIITNPIEFTSSESSFSANQISLSVKDKIFDGCNMDYYIAVDPWIAGHLTKNSGEVSWFNGISPDSVDGFDPDPTYTGTLGVRASELRRLEVAGYIGWTPYWVPVTPIESQSTGASASGTLSSRIVNLGAYEVNENVSDFTADSTPNVYNNIPFYDIYQFTAQPKSVTLRQGRKCWIQRQNTRDKRVTVEVEATFRAVVTAGQGTDYYITIGSGVNDEVGYVRSNGSIVEGSVSNIMWAYSNMDNQDAALLTVDNITKNTISDVNISYIDGVAVITKNPAAVWDFPDKIVKFKYTYIDNTQDYTILETNVYVPSNASPYITINTATGMDKIIISSPDVSFIKSTEYNYGQQVKAGGRLRLNNGWNLIQIYVTSKTPWNPITNVSLPSELEWYAYYAPLELVGAATLYNNTHKEDHSKCAVRYNNTDGKYYLIVNNPVFPEGTVTQTTFNNDGVVYWKYDGTIIDGAEDIFNSAVTVDDFYDLTYKVIGDYYTHVMLRVDLTGSNNTSPILYSYDIRGGDNLNIQVVV